MRLMMRLYIILMPRSLCVCVRLGVTFTFIFIINFYNNNPTITRAMLDLGWTQKQMKWMVKRIRKAFVRNLKDRGKMQTSLHQKGSWWNTFHPTS